MCVLLEVPVRIKRVVELLCFVHRSSRNEGQEHTRRLVLEEVIERQRSEFEVLGNLSACGLK